MRQVIRRVRFLAVVGLVLGCLLPGPAGAASYPRIMAATGDSITRAFNAGPIPFVDNPAASWSTGSDPSVPSHAARLRALAPSGKVIAYNDARSGAEMRDLNRQMAAVAAQRADYVTVLMGGNDVCTSSESTMTSVADFTAQFEAAMETLTSRLRKAKVYVVSIPDVYRLWGILHTDPTARTVWSALRICQSLLANPTSTEQADVDRRARVRARNIAFNDALASVCSRYAQCLFDGHAVFNERFTASDVSTRDYFHPSLSGQAKLAEVTWTAGYWGSS